MRPILNKLGQTELSILNSHVDGIREALNSIHVCGKLLSEFEMDDGFEDVIPEKLKSDFIRSGLLAAIIVSANSISHLADFLDEQIGGRK